MSWKKYFKPVNSTLPTQSRADISSKAMLSNFGSWLPEVYAGPPDRIQRYSVMDQMNLDHEISAALDTIADFGTEVDSKTNLPFVLKFNGDPTPAEIQILERSLSQWCRLNEMSRRIWRIFRSTLVYGDQFFIRDPETFKLYWIDPSKVERVIVNEGDGKRIQCYMVKDVDLNISSLVATNQLDRVARELVGASSIILSPPLNTGGSMAAGYLGSRSQANPPSPVDAEHVVHISLTEGMNSSWPFGISILEQIFKVFKQKELLEDSILIYRIHRAPERRMFFIDVGSMPPNRANQYLERIRYEVQQKRIPSRTGSGGNTMDSTYSPLSAMEDYFFAVGADGRGSKVEVLPGGENLGEITDLKYFNNKMLRALGVPTSYLPSGPDDGTSSVSDGRVGSAFIQEFRFSKVVSRYQQQIIKPLDLEFKLFLKNRGVVIDNSLFDLEFTPPQSFSEYRQMELDSAKINLFTAIADVSYVSKRFALKRYLGWTESELAENEQMWREERSRLSRKATGTGGTPGGLGGPAPTIGGAGGDMGGGEDFGSTGENDAGGASLSDVGITTSGIEGMGDETAGEDEGGETPSSFGGEEL